MGYKRTQTYFHSIVEQVVHTSIGFIITMICIGLFFPEIHFITNIKATAVMTIIKFVTHFGIRRLFTHYTYRIYKARYETKDKEINK